MNILILGASGYLGSALQQHLAATDWAKPAAAARGRRVAPSGTTLIHLDSCDMQAMTRVLRDFDCVVNCVAGDCVSIAVGARILAAAAAAAGCRRIVHLSSMAVYGRAEGFLAEPAPFDGGAGWYAKAKIEAEGHMQQFAARGGQVVVLRPGCVFGPACQLWVGRPGRWLLARRLGDLGASGDGWSNLVHIDDVCSAIATGLRLALQPGELRIFNLGDPTSPRWNDYLVDLGIAIGAAPIRRLSPRRIAADSKLAGAPLKIAEKLLDRLHLGHAWLPEPLSPSVVRLFGQEIRLDVRDATEALSMEWRGYWNSVPEFAAWFASCSAR